MFGVVEPDPGKTRLLEGSWLAASESDRRRIEPEIEHPRVVFAPFLTDREEMGGAARDPTLGDSAGIPWSARGGEWVAPPVGNIVHYQSESRRHRGFPSVSNDMDAPTDRSIMVLNATEPTTRKRMPNTSSAVVWVFSAFWMAASRFEDGGVIDVVMSSS